VEDLDNVLLSTPATVPGPIAGAGLHAAGVGAAGDDAEIGARLRQRERVDLSRSSF